MLRIGRCSPFKVVELVPKTFQVAYRRSKQQWRAREPARQMADGSAEDVSLRYEVPPHVMQNSGMESVEKVYADDSGAWRVIEVRAPPPRPYEPRASASAHGSSRLNPRSRPH